MFLESRDRLVEKFHW